jgi:peptidoglycan/xylan/chitin deacetylase (PgdA/CDA1 family)
VRAVLMFHSVDDSGTTLSVSPAQLMGITRAIRRSGHEVLSLGSLLADPSRQNCVAYTFDDGFETVARVAAPMLRDEGIRATLFLTTGYAGQDNDWPTQPRFAPSFPLMSWDDVEALHRDGWEIEAHTKTHPDLRELSDAGIVEEIEGSKAEIEARLGRAPQAFAYPYGYFDGRIVSAVRPHFRYAVTTQMARLQARNGDPYRIPRLDVYYLRHRIIHRRFGRPDNAAYLALRALLRRIRRSSGPA